MMRGLISAIDHFFVWAYGSKLNPLQRSGALAVVLLLTVIATGTYLLFFYSVSQPHESLLAIQNQWYLGKWIRSLHRYASDAAVLVVIYHSFSMLVRGKSWGPRTLAWLSGVGLMCSLFISGWTGFVMVWDLHGQELAQEGARLFQLVPFLRDDLRASFSGESPVPGSFFFMNLFLHVAIPLGMIFGLWLHISSMGKVKLLPEKPVLRLLLLSLFLLSVLWPAPLLEKGDLSRVIHAIPYDIWFSFFLPVSKKMSPEWSVSVIFIGLTIMLTATVWSSPKYFGKSGRFHRPPFNEFRPMVIARSIAVSLTILFLIGWGSQIAMNMSSVESLLRFNIHLPNLVEKNCHKPTAEERSGKLSHMQALIICDEVQLIHQVKIAVNDQVLIDEEVSSSRRDLFKMKTYLDHPINAGMSKVELTIVTRDPQKNILGGYELKESYQVPKGKIRLVSFKGGLEQLDL